MPEGGRCFFPKLAVSFVLLAHFWPALELIEPATKN